MSTLNAKVILNIKTAAEWATSTDILLEGEVAIESDTRLVKVGNGADVYSALPYTRISDINGIEGVTVTSPTDGQVLTYSNGVWSNVTPPSLPADTDLSHYDNSTSGFITASDIPVLPADTDLSHYDNSTSDFATVSQIPTDVSQLNNDAGYITSSDLPTVGDGTITIQKNSVNVDSFTTNQSANKTINLTVPTNLSELNNDVGYITSATLPPVNNGTLTIRQDGNTIATFTANSATNVVANLVGGGGGGGGGASYTSQLTVDSSLVPDTDSVYNLGDSTHRWTYLYSQYLSTGDGSALTVEQSIIPSVDSSFNLGSATYAYNNVYTDNLVLNGTSYSSIPTVNDATLTIQKNSVDVGTFTANASSNSTIDISVPTDTGDLTNGAGFITSAALPTVNDATLTIQRNSTTIDTFTANASSNVTVDISVPESISQIDIDNDIIPIQDNYYNLGTSSYRWGDAYIMEAVIGGAEFDASTVFPTGANIDLGKSTAGWSNVYATNVCTDHLYSFTNGGNDPIYISSDLVPQTSGLILGGPLYAWDELYIDTIKNAVGQSNIKIDANFIPTTTTYTLGDSSKQWSEVYTGKVLTNSTTLTVGGNDASSFNLIPSSTAASNSLGTSTSPWNEAYFGAAYISATSVNPVSSTDTLGDSLLGWNNVFTDAITSNNPPSGNFVISSTDRLYLKSYSTTLANTSTLILGNKRAVPETNLDIDLGEIDHRFNVLYSNKLDLYAVNTTTKKAEVRAYNSRLSLSSFYGGSGCTLSLRGSALCPDDGFDNTIDLGAQLTSSPATYLAYKRVFAYSYPTVSDERVKRDIEPLEDGLSTINDLNVKSYTFNKHQDFISYGVLAQEVVDKHPELVETAGEGENRSYSVYLQNVVYLAVRAIQELSSKVDELNAKIAVLERKV